MGDVENGSVLGLPLTKRSRVRNHFSVLPVVFVLLYNKEVSLISLALQQIAECCV